MNSLQQLSVKERNFLHIPQYFSQKYLKIHFTTLFLLNDKEIIQVLLQKLS